MQSVTIFGKTSDNGASPPTFFKKEVEWQSFAPPPIGTIVPIKTAQGTIKGVLSRVCQEEQAILLSLDCSPERARYVLEPEGWVQVPAFPG